MHEVVVRNVLHVEGAHNSVSQSRLMDRGLRIVSVNGFGVKINEKVVGTNDYRGGRYGKLVAVAPQVGGMFRLDVVKE
jgi:hypothetical protein